jgi:hypothetical protein
MSTILTSQDCIAKYGNPTGDATYLKLWDVPNDLELGVLPNRLYCHKLMIEPLSDVFKKLIDTKLFEKIITFDGCFNIRPQRGSVNNANFSIHSWGLAIDINAFENQQGQVPKLDMKIVEIFDEFGFDWGGYFYKQDGMHFQLKREMIFKT